jgi:hypothetical protein
VIVVVALTEGEKRHYETVTSAATAGVRTLTNAVTETVDKEGALLNDKNAQGSHDEKSSEGSHGATPKVTEGGWQNEANEKGNEFVVLVLPHHELVLAKVRHVVQGRLGVHFEKNPANVGPKKAILNIVRVIVIVGVLMVATMVGSPIENRVLESAGPEDTGEKPHRPLGLEGEVGKEAVVTQRDTHPGRYDVEEKKRAQKPIDTLREKIDGSANHRD